MVQTATHVPNQYPLRTHPPVSNQPSFSLAGPSLPKDSRAIKQLLRQPTDPEQRCNTTVLHVESPVEAVRIYTRVLMKCLRYDSPISAVNLLRDICAPFWVPVLVMASFVQKGAVSYIDRIDEASQPWDPSKFVRGAPRAI